MSITLQASPDGTYGEIKVNGSVVAKLPLSGNAVIPGLVGTVSQSGGVPTGAIVEQGSNANGQYVRFADGTQICTGVVGSTGSPNSLQDVNLGTYGWSFYAQTEQFTFAAAFSAAPRFSGSCGTLASTDAAIGGLLSGENVSATGGQMTAWSHTDAKRLLKYVAVGRWY